jgi:hypothetical protein
MLQTIGRLVFISSVLLAPATLAGQDATPNLDKDQRATLLSLVTAAKTTTTDPVPDTDWPVHLFRASDGSHYVAFSAPLPLDLDPAEPIAVYVRLVPRETSSVTSASAPQSAVEEWLLGLRSAPLPMSARRVVQVPTGEMPIGGPQTMSGRSARDPEGAQAAAAQSSGVLALMDRQRLQEREAREQRERERKAELEGRANPPPDLYPFEDFDMTARPVARTGRPSAIERALTTGPGRYDLLVAWSASGQRRPARTGVLRRQLELPNIPAGRLALGSIVLADKVGTRTDVYRPDQQASHPYAIGTTEIVPAADVNFTNDEHMAVAFQVINAAPSASGKPDVTIGFRLLRLKPAGEEPAGSLTPLQYDQSTLPADFDLALGHPILAGMNAPLTTLPRGEYRLVVTATDRVARSTASADTRFRIVASPRALVEAAPRLSPTFRREAMVEGEALARMVDLLRPQAATPTLQRLLGAAEAGRFVELMAAERLEGQERGLGLLLQGLGHYALGDTAITIVPQLRRALDAGAPSSVTDYLLGACWALDGRDADAIEAWNRAAASGLPGPVVALPVAEAHARLGQMEQAGRVAAGAIGHGTDDHALVLLASAADIAAGRETDALARLERPLAAEPDDGELQWMVMHALFSSIVRGEGPGATSEGRARFIALANTYIADDGRWSALAEEWRALVTSSEP